MTNGKVTNRNYISYKLDYTQNSAPPVKVIVTQWNETTADLGSHQQGFKVYTMDDVYAMTKNVWLSVDKAKNDIYFETKNDGLISLAGHRAHGCQDDCFDGVTITSITKL